MCRFMIKSIRHVILLFNTQCFAYILSDTHNSSLNHLYLACNQCLKTLSYIIFKTVINCIVFNLLCVYCHYMKLKLLFCITLMPVFSIIELFDFCHVKRIHIFGLVFSMQILVRVCHVITITWCTHSLYAEYVLRCIDFDVDTLGIICIIHVQRYPSFPCPR